MDDSSKQQQKIKKRKKIVLCFVGTYDSSNQD